MGMSKMVYMTLYKLEKIGEVKTITKYLKILQYRLIFSLQYVIYGM